MPTVSMTFSNVTVDPFINPEDAMTSMVPIKVVANQTLAAGTVMGVVTAMPGFYKPYASANTDGSQVPAGILRRAVTTDASGNITNGNEWGALDAATAIYTQGAFRTAELVGFDANAVTLLGGHLVGKGTPQEFYSF